MVWCLFDTGTSAAVMMTRVPTWQERLKVKCRLCADARWRHQMETFSALLAFCAGNSPATGEFPSQRPVTRSLMFSFICTWTNGWVNNRDYGDLKPHCAHDVTAMCHCVATLSTHHQSPLISVGCWTWVCNYTHSVVWNVITHPCPNFNGLGLGMGK